jgi:hypothetical protein
VQNQDRATGLIRRNLACQGENRAKSVSKILGVVCPARNAVLGRQRGMHMHLEVRSLIAGGDVRGVFGEYMHARGDIIGLALMEHDFRRGCAVPFDMTHIRRQSI